MEIFGLQVHAFASAILVVFTAEIFIFDFLRKKSPKINEFLIMISVERKIPDKVKWWFMVSFSIGCIFLYTYCTICKIYELDGAGGDRLLLDWIWRDMLGILPWFVWGCVVAGFVIRFMEEGRLRLPKSMLGAGAFASIIPICSCAAVPMAHGMMMGKQMRVRAIITFLIVVPVLSPVVYILAISQIGWTYLIVEIIAVFILAMLTGIIIEKLVGVKSEDDPGAGCYSCEGCRTAHMEEGQSSAMLAAWNQFMYLLKYILMGIIIGAMISSFVEPSDLIDIFGGEDAEFFRSLGGLVLIVCIAIPLFICSGEDVIILTPLLAMGLPLGHAIAFAIAGNAICVTAVPVLNATFGKKVTILIFAAFFIGAIALGLAINMISWSLGWSFTS